ncbi:OLC1v1025051C1 [Oldenlandia corymbosa var. corymbosa]|uniref:OLC1v1025051C1 n=1 Tax=Oldenlandia corymbosa var. corymbosa TaxID=529605 RepID=A0AAV1C3U4_OLDCO|nr:OLC1v1025051C1 [Oldenlandia corymbosa var. corymbosa]
MKVTISVEGSEFSLDVEPQESVLRIKQKIEHILRIPVASQALSIWGWELIDGLDMEDYSTIDESTKIVLTIRKPAPIPLPPANSKNRITVKFSARKIVLEVDQTETVRSLKEKIHIVDGTPIKRMALFFAGRELDEEFRYLTAYGISDNAEIVVFLKSAVSAADQLPVSRTPLLNVMVQTASCLLNSAMIPLDMIRDSSTVSELRQFLLKEKILPPDDYIFIHKQRIMRESCSLRWHGVENGDFLYVFKGTVSQGKV